MFLVKGALLYLVAINVFEQTTSSVELPSERDSDIRIAERIIRNTTNRLFVMLKLNRIKERKKLGHYSIVHNHLAKLSLQDCKMLDEVTNLSRVDSEFKDTGEIMEPLNEILNEENPKFDRLKRIYDENNIEYTVPKVDDADNKLHKFKKFFGVHKEQQNTQSNLLKMLYNELDWNSSNFTLDNSNVWPTNISLAADTRRIFRGRRVKIKKYPFVTSIHIFNKFHCAGSILSSDVIITAASCLQLAYNNRFFRENPTFVNVRVGSSYYAFGGELISVLELYFHPRFNPITLEHNLCLLRLVRRLRFRQRVKNIKRIEYDRKDWALPMLTSGIIILGWGSRDITNKIGDPVSNMLSHESLTYYPQKGCQDIYSKDYVTANHFCAGFISRGSGACNHDVGAPGLVNGILTGVASFGSPLCGQPDAPTVFVKLGFYASWIDEILAQEVVRARIRTTESSPSYKPKSITFPITTTFGPIPPYDIDETPKSIIEIETPEETLRSRIDLKEALKTIKEEDKEEYKSQVFKEFLKTMFVDKGEEEITSIMKVIVQQKQEGENKMMDTEKESITRTYDDDDDNSLPIPNTRSTPMGLEQEFEESEGDPEKESDESMTIPSEAIVTDKPKIREMRSVKSNVDAKLNPSSLYIKNFLNSAGGLQKGDYDPEVLEELANNNVLSSLLHDPVNENSSIMVGDINITEDIASNQNNRYINELNSNAKVPINVKASNSEIYELLTKDEMEDILKGAVN